MTKQEKKECQDEVVKKVITVLRKQVLPNADTLRSKIDFAIKRLEGIEIPIEAKIAVDSIICDLESTKGSFDLIKDPIRSSARFLQDSLNR